MLWPVIRIIVSVFLSVEMMFTCLFTGMPYNNDIEMKEYPLGEYTQYVDPFIGTGGTPWTCGMVSPAATAPFGTVRLGADTSFMGGIYLIKMNTSGYYYEQNHITGFSMSRLSGTGAEDYGCFRVTPIYGNNSKAVLPFSHKNERASAGYYSVYLPTANCLAEMTATVHTGVHRYTFYGDEDARLYLDASSVAAGYNSYGAEISYDEATGIISGKCVLDAQFSGRGDGLPVYFVAAANRDIVKAEITDNGESDRGIDLSFGALGGESVELTVAMSFVSTQNAMLNYEAEAKGLDFDTVRANTVADWDERLSSIMIETEDEDIKTIFYTALYHNMIMPTNYTDVNGEYLGFDKKVHTAEGFTYRSDLSLWDTVRTTHPLYTLIAQDIQHDTLNSLVEMANQGVGVIPRWAMGAGYTGSMLGSPTNILITESYLKGITDFDVQTAYEYMKNSSEKETERDSRDHIALYNEYGYIPEDLAPDDESVSRTIEYSWEDAAIASLASALGYEEDYEKYSAKSKYYKNLFDEETKYFRAKDSNGEFTWNFSPYINTYYDMVMIKKLASAYCEGSARQWRWSATHDIEGMIELFGSEEYFVSELEKFMKDASLTRAAIDPGSGYWLGNQHDLHTAYLFANASRSDLTQKWVRWTLENRFSTDVNGLDGNDDGGSLSAWYVFSAIGFYPLAGTTNYWIGSPNVDAAEVTLSNGNVLRITALNQSEDNIYVESVTLNGEKLDGVYVTHDQLMAGGEMVFTMSATPNK